MDRPLVFTIFTLRPWLFSVGVTEAIFILGMLFPILLLKCLCISYETLSVYWGVAGVLALSKTLLWALVELWFFVEQIDSQCKGIVYVYGLVLAIGHGVLVLGLCCIAIGYCRDKSKAG
jgi:hypothetical protein